MEYNENISVGMAMFRELPITKNHHGVSSLRKKKKGQTKNNME